MFSMIQISKVVLVALVAAFAPGIAVMQVSGAATSADAQEESDVAIIDGQNSTMIEDGETNFTDTEIAQVAKRVVTKQGTSSSPGVEGGPFQILDLLPARDDGRVYVGWITFTATRPIMVIPTQNYGVGNETFGTDFSDLLVFPGGFNGALVAAPLITPQYGNQVQTQIPVPETYSATVPFAGSGLSVGNLNGEAFLITYTINAVTHVPEVVDDVASAVTNETAVEGTRVSMVPGAAFLNDTAYDPNPVTVSVGDNVTWVNDDPDPHTVTSGSIGAPDAGEEFDSGYMGPHRSFTHRFDAAGEFDYFCLIHPNMVGTVVVEE